MLIHIGLILIKFWKECLPGFKPAVSFTSLIWVFSWDWTVTTKQYISLVRAGGSCRRCTEMFGTLEMILWGKKKKLSNCLKKQTIQTKYLKEIRWPFPIWLARLTYIVLAWMITLSQWTSLLGSLGRLLKEREACKASWDEAASPPPPCQFKTTHLPVSWPRTRSTEVI